MDELPQSIRDMRVQVGTGAARAAHIFDRTLLQSPIPMPAATVETNLLAHFGAFYGFALVEVLRMIEEHGDAEFTDQVLHTVNDIGANGDDGRCADVLPDIEARMRQGGVGTPE